MIPFPIIKGSTGSNIVYDVYAGETIYYQFIPTRLSHTQSSYDPFNIYYTLKGQSSALCSTNYDFRNNSASNEPGSNYLQSASWGAYTEPSSNCTKLLLNSSDTQMVWDSWPISGESNQYNWTPNNTYWYPFKANCNMNISKIGSQLCKVQRNGIWATLSTTARFTWT